MTAVPFQDDPTKRPLFDTLEGGPPRAWLCLLPKKDKECGRVCKNLVDMLQHQEKAHEFKPQAELELTPKETAE